MVCGKANSGLSEDFDLFLKTRLFDYKLISKFVQKNNLKDAIDCSPSNQGIKKLYEKTKLGRPC